jgi:MoaA/NifB/PqqE/SkfB family radical SAM enzyme
MNNPTAPEDLRSPRRVLTLLIELRCNSFCVFCGQREVDEALIRTRRRLGLATPSTSFGHVRERYTLATAVESLVSARAEGFDELSIQGGEPTLWPELPELVTKARELGFSFVGMVTNGRRLRDRGFAERLLAAGLHGLTVSLLGPDAETHDALAAASGAFDELVEGLRNVAAVREERGLGLHVNVNFIVSARSVDALAAEVRLVRRLGADAGGVHLVKFSGLGAEPGVRDPLRFDIRRIRGALARAEEAARETGFRLHAADIPPCLHPTLDPDNLRPFVRSAAIQEHRSLAPAFEYTIDHRRPRAEIAACEGCLLATTCPRVHPEYLPADASLGVTPLTPASIQRFVDGELADLSPEEPEAVDRLRRCDQVVQILATVAPPGALDASASMLREAFADLAAHAAARGRAEMALRAFWSFLGIDPLAPSRSPNRPAVPPRGAPPPRAGVASLRFEAGYTVSLEGTWAAEEGTIELSAFHPVAPPAPGRRGGSRLGLLFSVAVQQALRGARRLRVASGRVEVDLGSGWVVAFLPVREGAITLEPAGSEQSEYHQAGSEQAGSERPSPLEPRA